MLQGEWTIMRLIGLGKDHSQASLMSWGGGSGIFQNRKED